MNADPSLLVQASDMYTLFSQFRQFRGGLSELRLGLLWVDFEPPCLPPPRAHQQPPLLIRLGHDKISRQVDVITRPMRLV